MQEQGSCLMVAKIILLFDDLDVLILASTVFNGNAHVHTHTETVRKQRSPHISS